MVERWKDTLHLSWWIFWRMVVLAMVMNIVIGSGIGWVVGLILDALDLPQLTTAYLAFGLEFLVELAFWFLGLSIVMSLVVGVTIKGRTLTYGPAATGNTNGGG